MDKRGSSCWMWVGIPALRVTSTDATGVGVALLLLDSDQSLASPLGLLQYHPSRGKWCPITTGGSPDSLLYLCQHECPLASRVAQGVSGPSSSCVWNPRVFADDARGWRCPFVPWTTRPHSICASFTRSYGRWGAGEPAGLPSHPTPPFSLASLPLGSQHHA